MGIFLRRLREIAKEVATDASKAKTIATKREKNLSELRARQAKEKKESKKPTQKNLPDKKIEREGAQEESFKASQPAAGEGKVNVGKESGAIPNYAKDMMDNLSAKRKAALTKYFRNGESFKGMSAGQKRDAQYALRYVKREADSPSISTKQAISEGVKKARAAKQPDDYDHMLDTGEIRKGFNPTPRQLEQAIKNQKARGKTSRVRQLEARLESRDPAVRGLRGRDSGPFPGAGKPAGNPGDRVTEAGMVRKRGAAPYQPKELKGEDDLLKLLRRTERAGFKRGGLVKKGHKDYRKGGMFY
tara:strand:+ start:75 stop:980 length:906 start_codon:yes stop_codon:yes gene_type:complete